MSTESDLDLEKIATHEHNSKLEAEKGAPEHYPLGRSSTLNSTHPLEQTETRRPYTGIQWWLLCFALYIVCT